MFARFFASDPVKDISVQLEAYCPEVSLWPQVRAYLNQGKRPKDPKAMNALRAYLDLRDSLGSRSAFKNGAPLRHDALGGACARFFKNYKGQEHLGRQECRDWAQFCLAADYVLACAYSAKLLEGKLRKKAVRKVSEMCERIRQEYFEPLRGAAPVIDETCNSEARRIQAKAA